MEFQYITEPLEPGVHSVRDFAIEAPEGWLWRVYCRIRPDNSAAVFIANGEMREWVVRTDRTPGGGWTGSSDEDHQFGQEVVSALAFVAGIIAGEIELRLKGLQG